jgi:hypothetical protein
MISLEIILRRFNVTVEATPTDEYPYFRDERLKLRNGIKLDWKLRPNEVRKIADALELIRMDPDRFDTLARMPPPPPQPVGWWRLAIGLPLGGLALYLIVLIVAPML